MGVCFEVLLNPTPAPELELLMEKVNSVAL